MMKKMLVLALVLAVVGLANAGLSFDKTSLTDIKVVDVLGGTTSAGFYLQITGTAVFDLSAAVTQPGSTRADVIYQYPSFDAGGVASGAGQYFIDGAIPGNPKPLYAAGFVLVQGIKFVGGNGDLKLYDNENFTGTAIASATFIPEPMTMVLLGLGGLFLRKK